MHLREGMVLHEGLFQLASKPQAFFGVCLDFTVILAGFAHFDVFLEFFNLAILELAFELGLSVLPLELLHEERLKIVGLLAHRWVHS